MHTILVSSLFLLAYRPVSGKYCTPQDIVSNALENAPEAKKLMTRLYNFFLVYHSRNDTFKVAYPCLQAKRQTDVEETMRATYVFKYLFDGKFVTDHRQVSVERTDEAYPSENEFVVEINKEGDTIKVDFQVIYSDYQTCVLFWTWSLGYQVWVEASHLRDKRNVPRSCELLYHLLADNQKHVVYNQRTCHITDRKKSSGKKQPS
uniref:Secreted protein n=1 Tax=Amblyomma cajennense TaxID=34607 RepID=A0A023FQX4_AMBCJ